MSQTSLATLFRSSKARDSARAQRSVMKQPSPARHQLVPGPSASRSGNAPQQRHSTQPKDWRCPTPPTRQELSMYFLAADSEEESLSFRSLARKHASKGKAKAVEDQRSSSVPPLPGTTPLTVLPYRSPQRKNSPCCTVNKLKTHYKRSIAPCVPDHERDGSWDDEPLDYSSDSSIVTFSSANSDCAYESLSGGSDGEYQQQLDEPESEVEGHFFQFGAANASSSSSYSPLSQHALPLRSCSEIPVRAPSPQPQPRASQQKRKGRRGKRPNPNKEWAKRRDIGPKCNAKRKRQRQPSRTPTADCIDLATGHYVSSTHILDSPPQTVQEPVFTMPNPEAEPTLTVMKNVVTVETYNDQCHHEHLTAASQRPHPMEILSTPRTFSPTPDLDTLRLLLDSHPPSPSSSQTFLSRSSMSADVAPNGHLHHFGPDARQRSHEASLDMEQYVNMSPEIDPDIENEDWDDVSPSARQHLPSEHDQHSLSKSCLPSNTTALGFKASTASSGWTQTNRTNTNVSTSADSPLSIFKPLLKDQAKEKDRAASSSPTDTQSSTSSLHQSDADARAGSTDAASQWTDAAQLDPNLARELEALFQSMC